MQLPIPTTRAMETDQIKSARIIRNAPLTQEFMPLGYNRANILDRVADASFWGFNYGLDPRYAEEYGRDGKINFENFVRSVTVSNAINGNQFIWDPMPELENFPVSGFPEQVSQQYVLYNVEPTWFDRTLQTMHVHKQAVPTAYGAANNTQKPTSYVYQTPVTQLASNVGGSSLWVKIKTFFVGSGG